MIKPRIQHLPPLAVIVIIHIIVLSILATSCSERQKEKSSTSSHQANEFTSIIEEPDTDPLTSQDKSDTPEEMQAALDDAESTVEFCGRQWPLSTTGIGCVEPRDAPKPLDLTPLSKLTELKKLVLHNTSVENIAPLSSLVKLESLNLNDTKIKDLTPLIGLQKLRRLSLASTPGIDSFEPIRSISTLEYLNVNQNVNYKDHSITSKMGHLQTLIASLTGLNFLPQLPDQNSLKSLDSRSTGRPAVRKSAMLSVRRSSSRSRCWTLKVLRV